MLERSTLISLVGLFAALLACKSGSDDTSSDDSTTEEAAETAAASAAADPEPAPEQPVEAPPAEIPEFVGCELSVQPLQGSWFARVGARPTTWKLDGNAVTWHDTADHQSVLRLTSPCSFTTDEGNFNGIFVAASDQLYIGRDLVARSCGDRVVACTADGDVHVLAGGKCTRLHSTRDGVSASAGPEVRRWTREDTSCSMMGETLVVRRAGAPMARANKIDGVYRDVRWNASTVDSLETGKRLIELARELAVADESGPSRVKVTAGYEKVCDETKNAHACNNAAWYRCVNLKQCHQAVARARLAVEGAPNQPGFIDTLAVVLCRTGKTAEADQNFERSCAAGYSENCDKKCTPDEATSTVITTKPSAVPVASATPPPKGGGKRPARPGRPSRRAK